MKKRIKIILSICIPIFALLLFALFIGIFGFWSEDLILGKNLIDYCTKSEVDNTTKISTVQEYRGEYFYIHPVNNMLYEYNESKEDDVIAEVKMETFILLENEVFFVQDNYLMSKEFGSDEVHTIDTLGEYEKEHVTLYKTKLFYINSKKNLCSYDVISKEKAILEKKATYEFSIYGNHIFFAGGGSSLYAINMDGTEKNRIASSFILEYEIHNNHIYLTNDSHYLYDIDMENSTIDVIENSYAIQDISIVNEFIYYDIISSKLNNTQIDAPLLAKVNIDGESFEVVKEHPDLKCFTFSLGDYESYLYETEAEAIVEIWDEDQLVKRVALDQTSNSIMVFDDSVWVSGIKDGQPINTIYDKEFNVLDTIGESTN